MSVDVSVGRLPDFVQDTTTIPTSHGLDQPEDSMLVCMITCVVTSTSPTGDESVADRGVAGGSPPQPTHDDHEVQIGSGAAVQGRRL